MKKTLFILSILIMLNFYLGAENKSNIAIQDSYNAEYNANYSAAIDVMKSLEAEDNNEPFYKLRLGWLYFNLGKYSESLSYYQKAYKLKPSLESMEGITNCYMYLGLWNEAIAQADAILKENPYHTVAMLKAGYAMYQKKEYKAAIDYYNRVLKIYPYNIEARGWLVAAYYYNNDRINAKLHWQILKKLYPASPSVTDFAKVFE